MSDEKHDGCRVCGRTDVVPRADGTLRMHERADVKGSSFLAPTSGLCSGANHPPKGVLDRYALAVVEALRADFADLDEQVTAEVIGEAITQWLVTPYDSFECLLTSTGTWRLRAHRDRPSRVRVACWKSADRETETDRERESGLNAALGRIR